MRLVLRYACLCMLLLLKKSALHAQVASMGTLGASPLFSTEGYTSVTDSNRLFVIRDITISGNKKTQPSTILREVSFGIDQQYPLNVIVEKFYETKKQLMNTGLFRNVVVSLK